MGALVPLVDAATSILLVAFALLVVGFPNTSGDATADGPVLLSALLAVLEEPKTTVNVLAVGGPVLPVVFAVIVFDVAPNINDGAESVDALLLLTAGWDVAAACPKTNGVLMLLLAVGAGAAASDDE